MRDLVRDIEQLSIEGVDFAVVDLLVVIVLMLCFKYGKKDDGKTIFQQQDRHFDQEDNEGYI